MMARMVGERSGRTRRPHGIDIDDPALAAFWSVRLLCALTTLRADGSPHVVPVGATLDVPARLVRIITSADSLKARHVARAGSGAVSGTGTGTAGAPVAICQFEGRHWCTIEGRAVVLDDPAAVAEAEHRYAQRYRTPRPNPSRVVIAARVTRVLGTIPALEQADSPPRR